METTEGALLEALDDCLRAARRSVPATLRSTASIFMSRSLMRCRSCIEMAGGVFGLERGQFEKCVCAAMSRRNTPAALAPARSFAPKSELAGVGPAPARRNGARSRAGAPAARGRNARRRHRSAIGEQANRCHPGGAAGGNVPHLIGCTPANCQHRASTARTSSLRPSRPSKATLPRACSPSGRPCPPPGNRRRCGALRRPRAVNGPAD